MCSVVLLRGPTLCDLPLVGIYISAYAGVKDRSQLARMPKTRTNVKVDFLSTSNRLLVVYRGLL